MFGIELIESSLSNQYIGRYRSIKALVAVATIALGLPSLLGSREVEGKAPIAEVAQITSPASANDYSVGLFTLEGKVDPNSVVRVRLDGKPVESDNPQEGTKIPANVNGYYSVDIDIERPGPHMIAVDFVKDKKAGKKTLKVLVADAPADADAKPKQKDQGGDAATAPVVSSEDRGKATPGSDNKLPDTFQPEDDQTDVVYLPSEESDRGNEPIVKVDATVPATKKPAPKVPVAKEPVAKKPASKAGASASPEFVISSHTNRNIVDRGVVTIGGKGQPGSRVKLYVNNTLAMVGTIKPNGRWAFPVKIKTPGKKQFAAIDGASGRRLGVLLLVQ